MRFYSKVSAALWINVFTACVWVYIAFAHHTHTSIASAYKLTAAVWIFLGLVTVLMQLFCFWELRPEGLFERRLWNTRIIPFDQITRIAPALLGNKPRPGWLGIDFHRPAPMSESGTLLLAPSHPEQLLQALRQVAPRAAFVSS